MSAGLSYRWQKALITLKRIKRNRKKEKNTWWRHFPIIVCRLCRSSTSPLRQSRHFFCMGNAHTGISACAPQVLGLCRPVLARAQSPSKIFCTCLVLFAHEAWKEAAPYTYFRYSGLGIDESLIYGVTCFTQCDMKLQKGDKVSLKIKGMVFFNMAIPCQRDSEELKWAQRNSKELKGTLRNLKELWGTQRN